MKLNNNIKTAVRVAKIELNSMFYSPVACTGNIWFSDRNVICSNIWRAITLSRYGI